MPVVVTVRKGSDIVLSGSGEALLHIGEVVFLAGLPGEAGWELPGKIAVRRRGGLLGLGLV